ncbi:MAG: NAD(P)H-dependent oxidoreductase subunit E, partial [Chloroflexi bacterium]|nr:NAD(P)H-dependent oxidoreductase subunit E [Chloroflexota bacterium]
MSHKLEKFAADIRQGRASHAILFWLRVFVQHAQQETLRSDEWVDIGLREAATIPGLDATDLAPRLALLSDYDLFQAIRLKDQQLFIGPELAGLDWSRKYELSFQPDVSRDGALADWDCSELADCVEKLWQEVGPVSPQDKALEKLLAEHSPIWGGNGSGRSILLEVLHEAQAIYEGWLPRHVLTRIARALQVPLSDVYGVTEFYSMFYTQPVGQKIIRICEDGPCAIHGAAKVEAALRQHLQIKSSETTPDGEFTIEPMRCLGLCDHAPAVLVNDTRHFQVTPQRIHVLLSNTPRHGREHTNIGGLVKVAMSNVKVVDPTNLSEYRAQGGLAALRKVLQEMTPAEVIEAVKASKLVGRGGAA